MKSSDWKTLQAEIVAFRDARDWEQFHNAKDLALALSIEAAEVNELFLWKKAEEVDTSKLKDELADVFAYAFLLAHQQGFDVAAIIQDKMKRNADKYPVEKAKGKATKYDEL